MNAEMSMLIICVETIIYMLLHNSHGTFNDFKFLRTFGKIHRLNLSLHNLTYKLTKTITRTKEINSFVAFSKIL